MWGLDHKEGWIPKNWHFQTVLLDKTLESPLNNKEIKPVNPKGNQPWIFIWRTDAEAEAPIFWPLDAKSGLIRKDPNAGKDWRQEKRMTEGEMAGWHCRLDGHEFAKAPGTGDRQGSQVCCSPWGHKELDMTEQLKNRIRGWQDQPETYRIWVSRSAAPPGLRSPVHQVVQAQEPPEGFPPLPHF